MECLVSINCITYNHEKYIRDALDSFLNQRVNFDYEILIHDDASTDGTVNIIKEYVNKYPNIIKPIFQKENQQSKGVKKISYRFNHTRANGKYIAICEGDDYWTDMNKLQKQVDYLETHTDCTMCFHSAQIINDNKEFKSIMRPYHSNTICKTEDIIIGGGGFCPTQSIMYRKDAFDNPPDFYFDAPVGDYPLQIITASKGYAYYIDENMAVYRKVISSGSSWSSMTKSSESIIRVNEKINEMLDKFDIYTEYKYKGAVEEAKMINDFYSLVKAGKGLKTMNDRHKLYYSRLSKKQKIKVQAQCFFPRIYNKLLEMKYK